jgi:hypothetical protein
MHWSHVLLDAAPIKVASKFDCLKTPIVLGLESFDFSLFHCLTLLIFVLAVIHTLSANLVHRWARKLDIHHKPKHVYGIPESSSEIEKQGGLRRSLAIQLLYFLSEVEVIFAFWAIPLFLLIAIHFNWHTAVEYINTRDYTEPVFVVVIMALTATRPIIKLAEWFLRRIANRLGGTLSAWWYTLLTLGPLLGSLITEVAAMALCALLLTRQFFEYRPSTKLSYATLGLLFVNISVGGVLTDFASPAVLVLAHCWHWNTGFMMLHFGWKAILGILLSNALYWYYFRKEFAELNARKNLRNQIHTPRPEEPQMPVPYWVTAVHVFAIFWCVWNSHYPAVFVGGFLFFLGFHQATRSYQYPIRLARPLMIGLFLAGLVIHGGLQGWWVVDLLQGLSPLEVLGASILMTGFNDNTAISYLAILVPSWGAAFKYALFAGVVAGGGLTVIANAPNPAGYALLSRHFEGGISAVKLFLAAALPTFILYVIYFLTGPFF